MTISETWRPSTCWAAVSVLGRGPRTTPGQKHEHMQSHGEPLALWRRLWKMRFSVQKSFPAHINIKIIKSQLHRNSHNLPTNISRTTSHSKCFSRTMGWMPFASIKCFSWGHVCPPPQPHFFHSQSLPSECGRNYNCHFLEPMSFDSRLDLTPSLGPASFFANVTA